MNTLHLYELFLVARCSLRRFSLAAIWVSMTFFCLSGCTGRLGMEFPARLEPNSMADSLRGSDCAKDFPSGVAVDLLAADSLDRYFSQIQEGNAPAGGWTLGNHELIALAGGPYQHLITNCSFIDFQLEFAWVIAPAGNSGVKYLVDPARGPIGLEYQILDDERHPDAAKGLHRQAAALYDIYPPKSDKPLNPPGQLNQSMIIFRGKSVEHWLNGAQVLKFERGSEDFRRRVNSSKFKKIAGFGEQDAGRILIQHHSDVVKFTDFKITSLAESGN